MNEVIKQENNQIFHFGESSIRVVIREGLPWWVAKDVAEILGYAWSGSKTIGHVPEEWRGVESVSTPSSYQEMHVLSEQGLYFFLARSDKPKAIPFQMWVVGEVLPAIRKTGSYSMAQLTRRQIAQMVIDAEDARERAEAKIAQQAPLVQYAEIAGTAVNSVPMAEVANMIHKIDKTCGRNNLFSFLRDDGILQTDNRPYQKYMSWFEVVEKPILVGSDVVLKPVTWVRPAGVRYVINLWINRHDKNQIEMAVEQ